VRRQIRVGAEVAGMAPHLEAEYREQMIRMGVLAVDAVAVD
jgi:hypothetical protein